MVIVIVGVLAAFGVPRFIKSVERSKAAEAFAYLAAVRAAQETLLGPRRGLRVRPLGVDVKLPRPDSSGPGDVHDGPGGPGLNSWSLTLTRTGRRSGYGAYTVTFTQDGYDPSHSTIDGMAEIHPLVASRRPSRPSTIPGPRAVALTGTAATADADPGATRPSDQVRLPIWHPRRLRGRRARMRRAEERRSALPGRPRLLAGLRPGGALAGADPRRRRA